MSKGRVAPIKALTLPKPEMIAAVIATRMAKFVKTSLSVDPGAVEHVKEWGANIGYGMSDAEIKVHSKCE